LATLMRIEAPDDLDGAVLRESIRATRHDENPSGNHESAPTPTTFVSTRRKNGSGCRIDSNAARARSGAGHTRSVTVDIGRADR
jgi:hypothetical protein